jgi:AraC family transcriptional regulator
MRPTATGRILFWRGGSLWIGLAGEATSRHAHHAVQIALPFPHGRVQFQDRTGRWASYPAALVPAHRPHAFEARGQLVAQIFVEPESREGRRLQHCYHEEAIVALQTTTLAPGIAELAAAYGARASDTALIERASDVIASLSGGVTEPTRATDARIDRAVLLMREQLGGSIPLGRIASAVHLSPDRFRHLFVAETGVTFRAYLLWQRLERSLAAYIGGESLTDAALAAGFADSAHFSRTFRKMFGIAPASVRPESFT